MMRWQSFSSNVRQNIERYNQIELQRSSASTICRRCTDLENETRLSIDLQATGGGTALELSIDKPPPAITTSIEIKDNDGQGKISLQRVVSYTGSDENAAGQEDFRILEICRTNNLVSKLTKKFEGTAAVRGSSSSSSAFKKINEEFIRKSSIPKIDTNRLEVPTSRRPSDAASKKDYFIIEKTEVYEVKDKVKPNISPLIITKRSHSIGEITRHRKISPIATSPPPPPLPDTPIPTSPGVNLGGMEYILEADDAAAINGVQLRRPQRHRSSSGSRISVKTVEEILQQERFSKCFSEYSISDLLNDLPDDEDGDDIELTKFFNRIK